MGRKKKYHTIEEKKEAQKKWSMNYYNRHKKDINKKRMEKYYEQRNNKM